ncbi:hypothetical protein BVC80_8693g1 [Macleaya cordata]|uniref:Uncharacterized protein n=1 Tax=Macleaya cordata TaxID=56857 RepID=A0A200PRZ7_MACCD|nr:hypothetical protein BVC80_8693g1 [Macleaya cordata]
MRSSAMALRSRSVGADPNVADQASLGSDLEILRHLITGVTKELRVPLKIKFVYSPFPIKASITNETFKQED